MKGDFEEYHHKGTMTTFVLPHEHHPFKNSSISLRSNSYEDDVVRQERDNSGPLPYYDEHEAHRGEYSKRRSITGSRMSNESINISNATRSDDQSRKKQGGLFTTTLSSLSFSSPRIRRSSSSSTRKWSDQGNRRNPSGRRQFSTTTSVFSVTSPLSFSLSRSVGFTSKNPFSNNSKNDKNDEDSIDDKVISSPLSTSHNLHVTYNAELARFEGLEGLPLEWQTTINRQFGIPLKDAPKIALEEYSAKIPAVLVMLQNQLSARNGLESVGIFRIAPKKEESDRIKDAINRGAFFVEAGESTERKGDQHYYGDKENSLDVNIFANLIKVWFRECPDALYDGIQESYMDEVIALAASSSPQEVLKELEGGGVSKFKTSTHHALLLWLLDLMARVVHQQRTNLMTPKNLAIVISPNLVRFAPPDAPKEDVELRLSHRPSSSSSQVFQQFRFVQKVTEFTLVLLLARLECHHHQYNSSQIVEPSGKDTC